MAFVKRTGRYREYQGTSFVKSFARKDGSEWADNETGVFVVTDEENAEVLRKDLIKSTDKKSFTIKIDKSDTAAWNGKYRLIAYITDTNDAEIFDPVIDYELVYEDTRA